MIYIQYENKDLTLNQPRTGKTTNGFFDYYRPKDSSVFSLAHNYAFKDQSLCVFNYVLLICMAIVTN